MVGGSGGEWVGGKNLKVTALEFQLKKRQMVFHLPIPELHIYPGSIYPVMYTKVSLHKVKTLET